MLIRIAFLLMAVPLFAADPPTDLQGTWRLISAEAEADGINLPDAKPTLVIKGNKVLYGGKEIATISADPAASPKVIDFKFNDPDRTNEGIYTLEKGTLKICLNGQSEGVKERPTGFNLDGHSAWRLLTFEKIKQEEAGPGSGFVGIQLKSEESTKAIVIQAALDKSPAKAAGVLKDDVLLSVGGVAVDTLQNTVQTVRKAKPGDELALKVRRDDKELEIKVKVGILPFATLVGLE